MNQEQIDQAAADVKRLKIEVERLRAIERQVRYYLSSDGDTYQAYLELCEVCGFPPEEPEEVDEYIGRLEAQNKRLRAIVTAYGDCLRGDLTLGELEQVLIEANPSPASDSGANEAQNANS